MGDSGDIDYNTLYNQQATDMTASSSAANPIAAAMMLAMLVVYAVVAIVMIVSMWRLFTKAGKPGWAALVPIYNNIVMLEIAGRPWWWLLLGAVPLLGIWIGIVFLLDFMKSYGKSTVFAILSFLFPYVIFPMMAFSKSTQYRGPVAQGLPGFVPAPDRVQPAAAQPPVPPAMQ